MRWVLLFVSLIFWAAPAAAAISWLPSGQPKILSVTLDPGYFTGTPTTGTTIGTITVTTTGTGNGATFPGTLTLGGADASLFSVTSGVLKAATTLSHGVDYDLTVTPTQAGYEGSGVSVPIHVYGGLTYYMSPSGSDSNNGTSSGTPWLTVAHQVHCADTIIAAAGSYSPASFLYGTWINATCPNNDNVAWVTCVTAFACDVSGEIINTGSITVTANYWGVQGFTSSNPSSFYGACFMARPSTQGANVHHVVFANDIAQSGCGLGGFVTSYYGGGTGPTGVDYVMVIGGLTWNAISSSAFCGSGLSLVGSVVQDRAPGPHQIVAMNVGVANFAGHNCVNGGASGGETDGQAFMIDRPDALHYTEEIVLENNLAVGNGGGGFHTFYQGTIWPRHTVVRNNTAYGNNQNPNFCPFFWGDFMIEAYAKFTVLNNLSVPTNAGVCSVFLGNYALALGAIGDASLVDNNWLWHTVNPSLIQINYSGSFNCLTGPRVAFPGNNQVSYTLCPGTITQDPVFTGPVSTHGQWFCSGFSDTWACSAAYRAAFTPTATGPHGEPATDYGFTKIAPTDEHNSTPFFRNVFRALPANLNPHGF